VSIQKQLDELATLEPNWDSYGAEPIDQRAIITARQMIDGICVVSLNDGGVQIEIGCVEIEIAPQGHVSTVCDFYGH